MFALLLLSNQNLRTQMTLCQDESKRLREENKDLLRYKSLSEQLQRRQKELTEEVAQYRVNGNHRLSTNSNRELEILRTSLAKEKEVTNSLRKELATCVSRYFYISIFRIIYVSFGLCRIKTN